MAKASNTKSPKEASKLFHAIIKASVSDVSPWNKISEDYKHIKAPIPKENAKIEFKHTNTDVIERGTFLPFDGSHFMVRTIHSDALLLNSEYVWRVTK